MKNLSFTLSALFLLLLCFWVPPQSTQAQSAEIPITPEEIRFVFLVSQSRMSMTIDSTNARSQVVLNAINYLYRFYVDVLQRVAFGHYDLSFSVVYFGELNHTVNFIVRGTQQNWIGFQDYSGQNGVQEFQSDFQDWLSRLSSLPCASQVTSNANCDRGADHNNAINTALAMFPQAPNNGATAYDAIFILSDGVDCGPTANPVTGAGIVPCIYNNTTSPLLTSAAARNINNNIQAFSNTQISFIGYDRSGPGFFQGLSNQWQSFTSGINFIPSYAQIDSGIRLTDISQQGTDALIGAINDTLFEGVFQNGLPDGLNVYSFNPSAPSNLFNTDTINNMLSSKHVCLGDEVYVFPLVDNVSFFMMQYDMRYSDLLSFPILVTRPENVRPPDRPNRMRPIPEQMWEPMPMYESQTVAANGYCHRPTLRNINQFNFSSNNRLLVSQRQLALQTQTNVQSSNPVINMYQYGTLDLQVNLGSTSIDLRALGLELRAVIDPEPVLGRSADPRHYELADFTTHSEIIDYDGNHSLRYELVRPATPNTGSSEEVLLTSTVYDLSVQSVNFAFVDACAAGTIIVARPGDIIDFSAQFTNESGIALPNVPNFGAAIADWGVQLSSHFNDRQQPVVEGNINNISIPSFNLASPSQMMSTTVFERYPTLWRVPNVDSSYTLSVSPTLRNTQNSRIPEITCQVEVVPLQLTVNYLEDNETKHTVIVQLSNQNDINWIMQRQTTLTPGPLELIWEIDNDSTGHWSQPSKTTFGESEVDASIWEANRDFLNVTDNPNRISEFVNISFRIMLDGYQIYPLDTNPEDNILPDAQHISSPTLFR